MLKTFLLTIIPIILSSFVAAFSGGESILGIFDLPDFFGVISTFSICIFISGYGKSFCKIFLTKAKYNSLNLEELQKIETSLNMASKILLYSALLFPIMSFITLLFETSYKDCDYSSIGPNSALCFLSGVYLCLFEMIIYTLKAKNKKSIIMYMAETEETAEQIKNPTIKSVIKIILAIILMAAVSWVYAFSYFGFGLLRFSVIDSIFDILSLVCILVYTLPLIAISGCLGDLLGAIKTVFSTKGINVAKKNLYLNAVKTTSILNWYGAITSTVIGWIGMMNNLEDASLLFPNIAISLVTLFYAVILNMLLLIVEVRINKVSA